MSSADDPSGETRYSPLLDQSTLLDPNLRDDGGDSSTPPANEKFPKRIPGACEHCRSKKLRCEVTRPCKRCLKDGLDCRPVPKVVRTPLSRNNMTMFQARTEMDDMFWAGVFPNYRYRLDQMGERLGQIGVDNMRQELIEALQEEMKHNRYPEQPLNLRPRSRSPRPESSFQPDFPIDPALSNLASDRSHTQAQPHPPLTLADLNYNVAGIKGNSEGGAKIEDDFNVEDGLGYLGPLARRILNADQEGLRKEPEQ